MDLGNGRVVVVRRDRRRAGQGDPKYAFEKFGEARYILATHPGAIRDRLWKATSAFIMVFEADIPPAVRAKYKRLKRDITSLAPKSPTQDRVVATVGRVRLATCERFARLICEIADDLDDHLRPRSA